MGKMLAIKYKFNKQLLVLILISLGYSDNYYYLSNDRMTVSAEYISIEPYRKKNLIVRVHTPDYDNDHVSLANRTEDNKYYDELLNVLLDLRGDSIIVTMDELTYVLYSSNIAYKVASSEYRRRLDLASAEYKQMLDREQEHMMAMASAGIVYISPLLLNLPKVEKDPKTSTFVFEDSLYKEYFKKPVTKSEKATQSGSAYKYENSNYGATQFNTNMFNSANSSNRVTNEYNKKRCFDSANDALKSAQQQQDWEIKHGSISAITTQRIMQAQRWLNSCSNY